MARRISRGDVHRRLRASLRQSEPKLVRILGSLRGDLRQVYTYQEIGQALQSGNLTPTALDKWRQDYSRFVVDKLTPEWQKQADNAGKAAATDISAAAGEPFAWQPNSRLVTEWIETRGAERVVAWTDLQHEAAQSIIRQAMTEGTSADELGIRLRAVTGLTPRQAEAVEKMRAALVADGGMSQEQAAKQAQRYADMLHRQRALRIARTETAAAYNHGQDSAVREAIGQGMFDGAVTRSWSTADDERVCSECSELDGKTISIEGQFETVGGMVDVPPAHPGCRCCATYDVET